MGVRASQSLGNAGLGKLASLSEVGASSFHRSAFARIHELIPKTAGAAILLVLSSKAARTAVMVPVSTCKQMSSIVGGVDIAVVRVRFAFKESVLRILRFNETNCRGRVRVSAST